MKNKTKLLMTLISMCLVITLGVIGILAVKKLDLNIGGNVSFTAEGVDVTVGNGAFFSDASHIDTYGEGVVTYITGKEVAGVNPLTGFTMNTNTPLSSISNQLSSWSNLQINLNAQEDDGYLAFEVTNNMTNKDIYVTVTINNGTQDTNKNISIKNISEKDTIAGGTKEYMVFHFDIEDPFVNASLTGFTIQVSFGLEQTQVVLDNQGKVSSSTPQFAGINYTVDPTTETVTMAYDWESAETEIVIASSVKTADGKTYAVTEIPNYMFSDPNDELNKALITSVVIPDGITTIGECAFMHCVRLTSVTIPNSVTEIGDGAFMYCTSLTSVIIPNSVTEIGDDAFSGCRSLISVIIPNSVTEIPNGAFSGCSSLTSVTIPNSVTEIGGGAFSYCRNLTTMNIPNSLTAIGNGAFSNCSNLTTMNIPNSLTTIGCSAFDGSPWFSNLVSGKTTQENVVIQDGIMYIKSVLYTALDNDKTNVKLTIPDNITYISSWAFYSCDWISEVIIPDSITIIEDNTFFNSTIESVTIPSSVTIIGSYAFWECPNLTTIIIEATNPPDIRYSAFDCFISPNAIFTVPDSAYATYKANPAWKDFPYSNAVA